MAAVAGCGRRDGRCGRLESVVLGVAWRKRGGSLAVVAVFGWRRRSRGYGS